MNRRFLLGTHGAWLEQAGEVELLGGWAQVTFDEAFARQVAGADYEVYLSSYGAAVVFVQNRTPAVFAIHAMPAPGQRRHATVSCAYRVVARVAS